MRQLTDNEIKFIKETHFTPTVFQCDEYVKTSFKNLAEAEKAAKEDYAVDLTALYNACVEECDGISLEYEATYLFHTFFTRDELVNLTPEKALQFLQDFQYFFGYRKWPLDFAADEVQEAIEIYDGKREFQIIDGAIWNREKDD